MREDTTKINADSEQAANQNGRKNLVATDVEDNGEMAVVPTSINNDNEVQMMETEVQMGGEMIQSQSQVRTTAMMDKSSTNGALSNTMQTASTNVQTRAELVQSQAHSATVPPIPRAATGEVQVRTTAGSAQRKRSRLGEDSTLNCGSASLTRLHEHVDALDFHIENLQKNGSKANTATARAQLADSARGVLVESSNLMAKVVNGQEIQLCYQKTEKVMRDRIITLQEENMNLKQQIIEYQAKEINNNAEGRSIPVSYMGAVMKNLGESISAGKKLPIPYIAENVKHAPSECVIIIKAEKRGEMLTKSEQEKFRRELKETIGAESMHYISAIRPTRFGGHTIIFQTEQQRNKIFEKLKQKEKENNVKEEESCMIAPKRKVAKAVCKEPPSDISIEGIKMVMYGRHNPAMELVPQIHRVGNIIRTRLGLVFELSSAEMQAIQMQDWRLRCDMGREMRLEEFIPLQQCYACCKFGHNAEECKAENEACRLCGKEDHSGKNCPHKDDKDKWRCINCKRMNLMKNLQLDDKHAAAQLHKYPIAQQQKSIRKIQLAASGVFTTPIIKGSDQLGFSGPTNNKNQQATNGGRGTINNKGTETDKKKNRSTSRKPQFLPFSSSASSSSVTNRKIPMTSSTATCFSSSRPFSTSSSSTFSQSRSQEQNENPCVQKSTKVIRTPATDGWQTVGKKGAEKKSGGNDRGRGSLGQVGVNSTNNMVIEDENLILTPSQREYRRSDG